MTNYLIALVLTIVIEVAVARLFGYKRKSELLTVIYINIITNPLLNYILFMGSYFKIFQISTSIVLLLEGIVVLIEWLLLVFALRQNPKKLFVLSLVMNCCSYFAGLLIFR